MAKVIRHVPVLLDEAIEFLAVASGKKYIDATAGGGGHTRAIVERGGVVLGMDWDKEALKAARSDLSLTCPSKSLILARGNFAKMGEIARERGFCPVAGVLFDLGVSSFQLAVARRGFSFRKPGPLDMRMDQDLGVTAADLVNSLSEKQLYEVFGKMGEERMAWPIARRIVGARTLKRIETTEELSDLVVEVYAKKRVRSGKIHPATRVFMALRMVVNFELDNLREGLGEAVELLAPGGRLVVISFHSGEDRVVKQFLREGEVKGNLAILTKSPVVPREEEVEVNVRARSAKLRAAEKIGTGQ